MDARTLLTILTVIIGAIGIVNTWVLFLFKGLRRDISDLRNDFTQHLNYHLEKS